MKKEKKEESEFGRGLIVPLVKFLAHYSSEDFARIGRARWYLNQSKEDQEIIVSDNPPPNKNYGRDIKDFLSYFNSMKQVYVKSHEEVYHDVIPNPDEYTVQRMLDVWFYGAADHLSELEYPQKLIAGLAAKEAVNKLRDGLRYRLPLDNESHITFDIAQNLANEAKAVLIAIDRLFNKNAEWGRWD